MVFVTNNAAKVQLLFEFISLLPVLPRQTVRQEGTESRPHPAQLLTINY